MNAKRLTLLVITYFTYACGGTSSNNDTLYYDLPELRITSFTISGYDLDFDEESTGLYELDVDSDVETVDVNFTVSDDAQAGETHYTLNGVYQDELTDTSGSHALSVDLNEGSNVIKVTLIDEEEISTLSYNFNIYRTYSTASLSGLLLYELPSGISATNDLSPSFESDTYSYQVTLPYSSCSIAAVPVANSSSSTIVSNDVESNSEESLYQSLEVGRNFLDIYLKSEDEEREERYALEINRETPSDAARLANANLKSLSITNTDIEYICGITDYALFINNNVHSVTLDLETEVDGAEIWIDDERVDPSESIPIEIDTNQQSTSIRVDSADGSTSITYNVEFFRRSNNYVYVETAEELAYALLNARPNDFIEIAEGDYDVSSVPESMLTNGALVIDSSGSALQPIVVSVETEDETNIVGSNESGAPLLEFTGSHWQIYGLNISQADYGIEFNGAQNIMLSGITFSDIDHAAIVEQNGTNNMVRLSRFENIAYEQADTSFIEISEASSDFDVRQNTFVLSDNSRAISINSSSTTPIIESNTFTHSEDLLELEQSVITSSADGTSIFYNVFDFNIKHQNQALITLGEAPSDQAAGIYIYENRIKDIETDSDGQRVFLNSEFSPTFLHLPDHTPEAFTVSGDDIQSWSPPNYKIVVQDDNNYCLSLYQNEDTDYGSDTEENSIALDVCNGDAEQSWQIEVGESAPYIKFKNVSIESEYAYLSTISNFYSYCGLSEDFPSVYLDEDVGGFGQRWLLQKSNYDLSIRSQILSDYSLTLADSQADVDDGVSLCPSVGASSQTFSLVPL